MEKLLTAGNKHKAQKNAIAFRNKCDGIEGEYNCKHLVINIKRFDDHALEVFFDDGESVITDGNYAEYG